MRETQRRASIIQGCGAGITPNILVSEPSCQDFEEQFYLGTPRRASTQSMGPVVVPVSFLLYVLHYQLIEKDIKMSLYSSYFQLK